MDLTLLPGTVTALCGGSGGGKSSIAGLVLRNYDVLVGRERRRREDDERVAVGGTRDEGRGRAWQRPFESLNGGIQRSDTE